MKQINAKPRRTIPLGHRGENEARQIIFDLTDYISTYGTGTARLLHQRDGDPAPYIVPAAQSDTTLVWAVTDADTAVPGDGCAELQWMVENALAKSDIWCTKTKASLDDGATAPPTGAEGWYQQLVAYIDSLRGEGVSEEQIAAAVEAYLEENPVDVPVTSVNGKTGAVQLTAEDVGALAQDNLQAGVDAALEQAKASGEFDGQAGDDGGYYTPSVDAGGNLLWAASKEDMPAVAGANIKGPPGTTGKSAYQYAMEGGYTGTEAEFAGKLAQEKFANPNALTFTGAVTGSYDGSAAVSVEIPSGGGGSGGGGQAFANDLLAEGTIASGLSAWTKVDAGLTVGDLRKYKSFVILLTGDITGGLYYSFGTNIGEVKNAIRFEWEDDAKTILMCDGYSKYTTFFSNNYKAYIEYWGTNRPWIRFDFRETADSCAINFMNVTATTSEVAYQIMGWMK